MAEIGEALSYFLADITLPVGAADWLFSAPSESRPRVLDSLRRARAAAALAEGAPDTALTLLVTGDAAPVTARTRWTGPGTRGSSPARTRRSTTSGRPCGT